MVRDCRTWVRKERLQTWDPRAEAYNPERKLTHGELLRGWQSDSVVRNDEVSVHFSEPCPHDLGLGLCL